MCLEPLDSSHVTSMGFHCHPAVPPSPDPESENPPSISSLSADLAFYFMRKSKIFQLEFRPILSSLSYILIFALCFSFSRLTVHAPTLPTHTPTHSSCGVMFHKSFLFQLISFLIFFLAISLCLHTCLGLSHSKKSFLHPISLNYCFVLSFQMQNSERACIKITASVFSLVEPLQSGFHLTKVVLKVSNDF